MFIKMYIYIITYNILYYKKELESEVKTSYILNKYIYSISNE